MCASAHGPAARKRRRGGTRAAEENRSRGDRLAGGGGNFHPFRLSPRLGGGGGGRWSPRPSTANRNKFHADHATSCVYIHIYVFRFARILLSSLSLSLSLLQPFYCLLFSSVDPRLDSIRVRGWGGRIRVEGKWAWRGVGRSAVVVGLSGKIYLLGDLTKVVFVICIDLYLCARGLLGIYNIGGGDGIGE